MRGEIIDFDPAQKVGRIGGDDGVVYRFIAEEVRRPMDIGNGRAVEFDEHGGWARNIVDMEDLSTTRVPKLRRVTSTGDSLWGYFVDALLVKFVDFKGRATRKEYWGYSLFSMLLLAPFFFFAAAALMSGNPLAWIAVPLAVVVMGAVIVCGWAVTVRRLHDIGLSGWVLVIASLAQAFTPLFALSSAMAVALLFFDSERRDNIHGANPKQTAVDAAVDQ